MKYSQELIDLLNSNENITSLWVNADATEWHLHYRPSEEYTEVTREQVLKSTKTK